VHASACNDHYITHRREGNVLANEIVASVHKVKLWCREFLEFEPGDYGVIYSQVFTVLRSLYNHSNFPSNSYSHEMASKTRIETPVLPNSAVILILPAQLAL